MRQLLAVLLSVSLLTPAVAEPVGLLERWGIPAEHLAKLPGAEQARLLRGLVLLDAGERIQIEKLKRLAPERWTEFVTSEGRLTREGFALLQELQAEHADAVADLDVAKLGLDREKLQEIAEGMSSGAPVEQLAAQANEMFDKTPSTAKFIGEAGVAATGGAAAASLSDALALADTAMGEAAQAQALGTQARALAAQGQLAQAQRAGAEALAHKQAALEAKEAAQSAADKGKALGRVAGALALADGLWDLYKGTTQKQQLKGALAVEKGYQEAYRAVAAGAEPKAGERVAAGYAQLFGEQASPAQLQVLAAAVDDGIAALHPSAAVAAAEATQGVVSALERGVKDQRERQRIGGVKSGSGLTMLATTNPTTAMAAAVVYFLASIYQQRQSIKDAWKNRTPPETFPPSAGD